MLGVGVMLMGDLEDCSYLYGWISFPCCAPLEDVAADQAVVRFLPHTKSTTTQAVNRDREMGANFGRTQAGTCSRNIILEWSDRTNHRLFEPSDLRFVS